MEENKYLIELSDYEYKVITEEELQEAKDDVEELRLMKCNLLKKYK